MFPKTFPFSRFLWTVCTCGMEKPSATAPTRSRCSSTQMRNSTEHPRSLMPRLLYAAGYKNTTQTPSANFPHLTLTSSKRDFGAVHQKASSVFLTFNYLRYSHLSGRPYHSLLSPSPETNIKAILKVWHSHLSSLMHLFYYFFIYSWNLCLLGDSFQLLSSRTQETRDYLVL